MTIDAGYEASSLELVEDVLDSLSPATSEEVYLQTRDVSERAIAAVAASRGASPGSDLPGVMSPVDVRLFQGESAIGIGNYGFGVRVVAPRSGTLTDLAIYIGNVSAGNISVAVYSTDEPRARLFTTGAIACPPAAAWTIVGDPQLEVEAGAQYDFALSASDDTAVFAWTRFSPSPGSTTMFDLPFDLGVDAIPALAWYREASHPLPATIANASVGRGARNVFAILGRVE